MNRIELNGGADFVCWRYGAGGTVEIFDINVRTKVRNGIGKSLITLLESQIKEPCNLFAITRATNSVGINFYLGVGFSQTAILANFYITNNEYTDAIIFCKKINQ